MKASKVFLIIETITMYLSTLFLIIAFFMALNNNDDRFGDAIGTMALLMFIFEMVSLFVAFLTCCFSLFSLFNNKGIAKLSMIIKLTLILWFLLNFLKWSLYVMGMLNPFLMLGIPIVIALGVLLTYFLMLSTSANNIFFIIRRIPKSNNKGLLIVSLIFHFVFCLDVVGSIMLYIDDKKRGSVVID